MKFTPVSPRAIALLTGFALATTAFGIAPAHAAEKSKKLKYGAIAAGVAGAYFLSKGKTVPAAVLGGAGYYAYKKSEKARDEERFGSNRDRYRSDRDRYGYNRGDFGNRNGDSRDNDFRSGDVYPEDGSTEYRANAAVRPNRRQGRGNYDLNPYRR